MKCPRCGYEEFASIQPCPKCNFSGPPAQIEELAHIIYLMGEMGSWRQIPPAAWNGLRRRYLNRRQELEAALGLHAPPAAEQPAAPPPAEPAPPQETPPPVVAEPPPPPPPPPPPVERPAAPPEPAPPAPPPPRPRLTWERLWPLLISERFLRAMLLVAVFMVITGAVMGVVRNWNRYPPLLQGAFLIAFTLSFYAAGWYVHTRTRLRRFGSIALFATGSLLVPVDFGAFHLFGGLWPRAAWAEVWLIASAVCLVIYTVTAILLAVELFGYLPAVALGSLLCAFLQVIGVSSDWWGAALCGLSLALLAWPRREDVFRRPFRNVALLTTTTVLCIATGLRVAQGVARPSFRWALAMDWWLACAVYALAAARSPRRALVSAACVAAPVALALTLTPVFEPAGVHPAWNALGWAMLTPLYLITARRLRGRPGYGSVGEWGALLMIWAAGWALRDMPAAAAAHAALTGSALLAVVLWRRPALLLFASALSLSAMTAGMAAQGFDLAQYSVGWVTLTFLHFVGAVWLRRLERYTPYVYAAGFGAAALALLPPLVAFDREWAAFALFLWMAHAGWAAYLAHGEEHPGLLRLLRLAGPLRRAILLWATALPFPLWLWLAWENIRAGMAWQQVKAGLTFLLARWTVTEAVLTWFQARAAYAWLGVGFAATAWGCLWLGRRLARYDRAYGPPWYTVSFLCSAFGVVVALLSGDQCLLAAALIGAAALYFRYAGLFRLRWWLLAGGLTLPCGYITLLDYLGLPDDPLAASLALLPAAYFLTALWLERRRGAAARFLEPLYGAAHIVAAATFIWSFGGLWNDVAWNVEWSDAAMLWAAGGQLTLGATYGLMAWFLGEEAWGHIAAWLGVIGGGIIASAYSQGRGSSAFKAALIAVAYVLAERTLYALRGRHPLPGKAWPLYRRPLLIAGWAVSGAAIALALVRNLLLLREGPPELLMMRRDWAIAGLLTIVALYAASARMFRRPLFLWLAAPLLFAPWTLLTYRGWYIAATPPAAIWYGPAWAALAWLLAGTGYQLDGRAGREYGLPLRVVAHLLTPFALIWVGARAAGNGAALSTAAPSTTCALGLAFYIAAAIVDRRRGRVGLAAARFLYPAAFLLPILSLYLPAWPWAWLPQAHFGLLLLLIPTPLSFLIARRLHRVDSSAALPFYLSCYGGAIAGAMLVSYERGLLTLALLYCAGLTLLSARLLREPLWLYPATALPPAALLLALAEVAFNLHRRGWWLIGLGAVYLTIAWLLRRARRPQYAVPPMAAAYAIIALALPISSYEQRAAFWAYGAAAIIYAVSAAWLREPLFLTPAAGLASVPYVILLNWAGVERLNYGLALWPGVVAALGLAAALDYGLGAPRGFPWGDPFRWPQEAARRIAEWWGLPFYVWGLTGALAAVGLSADSNARLALTLTLAALAYGFVTWRFRLRGWLLAALALLQAAALAALWTLAELEGLDPLWAGRLLRPAWQACLFLPVTCITLLAGLLIEREHGEGSPCAGWRAAWAGWSRPFYWLAAFDVLAAQFISLANAQPGCLVSVTHALLSFGLAIIWTQPTLPYLAAGLGFVAVFQRFVWARGAHTDLPWALALLAMGYGIIGYGLEYLSDSSPRRAEARTTNRLRVLERPLQRSGHIIQSIALLTTAAYGARIPRWVVRAMFGLPMLAARDIPVVQMAVAVLAFAGLFYLTAALVRRWYWRGYGAVALLLCAYGLESLLVWGQREVQWYAVPAGLYLLVIAWLEWREGRKPLARWIDRTALLLLLGSAFYQSLAEPNGWPYAMLMMGESLLLLPWGGLRRRLIFLYSGVVGVTTAVGGQIARQIFSVNAWIAVTAPGVVLILLILFLEHRMEALKELFAQLEEWE